VFFNKLSTDAVIFQELGSQIRRYFISIELEKGVKPEVMDGVFIYNPEKKISIKEIDEIEASPAFITSVDDNPLIAFAAKSYAMKQDSSLIYTRETNLEKIAEEHAENVVFQKSKFIQLYLEEQNNI